MVLSTDIHDSTMGLACLCRRSPAVVETRLDKYLRRLLEMLGRWQIIIYLLWRTQP